VKNFDPSLYLVTDRGLSRGRSHEEVVRRAIAGGATLVQYREKKLPVDAMADEAARILRVCRERGVPFIVNDSLETARRIGADGLHLGQDDLDPAEARAILGEGFVIGVSVHDAREAEEAERKGADYVAANGVFPTASKLDLGTPLTLAGLSAIARATSLPVVAIGGIHAGNAADAIRAGAAGVAVISAVVSADDIEGACGALRAAIDAARGGGGGGASR
jgi:thiamine-phosphate pyrophosphorylase